MTVQNFTVTPAKEWHSDPIEDYPVRSSPRGICLIINNVEFDNEVFPKRKGSDMDAFRFKSIFGHMDFIVESKRNLNSDKMKLALKQVAAKCSAKHDALVVILLSHGSETGIFGKDSVEVDFNDILSYFDNKRCRQMKGKPKIFIVQACRGQQTDFGVRDSQAFFSQPESQSFSQPSQLTQINSQSPKLTSYLEVDRRGQPTRSDFLLAFSCHRGYVSTRNEEEGSWLGASLAQHLMEEAHRKHLLEILNMVSRDVRKRKSADGLKQVLEITCIGFDRNFYFNPGLTQDTTVNSTTDTAIH